MAGPTHAAVALLDAAARRGDTAGWALAAGRGPATELTAAGGLAQSAPGERPVTADTRFDLASLTKVVATLPVVLRLIARGALALTTRTGDVLAGSGAGRCTVAELLTHTAGLDPDPDPNWRRLPAAEHWARIIAIVPSAPPGTRVGYSDIGFLLLGAIAETVGGRRLDALFAEEVAAPLALTRTRFGPLAPPHDDVAATERRADGTPTLATVHDETAAALARPTGHAGLFSDAADLARYLAAWTDPDERWLPAELRAAALRDHTAATGTGHRGLGWSARRDPHDQLGDAWPDTGVFHSGFTGTSLALDPVSRRWVVLLTNDVHLGRGRGIINPLRRAVHTALAP